MWQACAGKGPACCNDLVIIKLMDTIGRLVLGFPYALASGILVAGVCSALGVFVILKRMVFVGIAMSEVAACGIAIALMIGLNPFLGAIALTMAAVGILAYPYENMRIPRDVILGWVFVTASAATLAIVYKSGLSLDEVRLVLYGDLILTDLKDLVVLTLVLLPVGGCYIGFLRPILDSFLDRQAAKVMGLRPVIWEWLYFMLLGLMVAVASKIAGSVLVFCYLVVCPATGLLASKRFGWVTFISLCSGVLGTVTGLAAAVAWDLPANPSACLACCSILAVVAVGSRIWSRLATVASR